MESNKNERFENDEEDEEDIVDSDLDKELEGRADRQVVIQASKKKQADEGEGSDEWEKEFDREL